MNTSLLRASLTRIAALAMVISSFSPLATHAASSAISIGTVSPVSASVGIPVTLSANVSSNAGSISSCSLYVDNDDKGAMTINGNSASRAYTFTSVQVYTVFVFCRDSMNNFNSGANIAVWAQGTGGSGGSGSDIVPPAIGSVSPASAEAMKAVTLSVAVSDAGGVSSCHLYVDSQDVGAMTIAAGVASKSYTFTTAKTYATYVSCNDLASNTGTGSNTAISVSPHVVTTGPAQGSLVKLVCPAGTGADHPCKAVYFVGKDGKRHAFPNSKVYFTWYADFSTVKDISSSDLATLTLGSNVIYRPGARMLKFVSLPKVYAVAAGGKLRWIKTEADAVALYGTDWSKKVDDIDDAFFAGYSFGTDVDATSPFNIQTELNGATSIDATL
ncbi:MAG: hypothetical protein ABIO72_02730 [Patescibacteria group bacterium]